MRAKRGPYKRKSFSERFWEKIDTSGDCWLWTAAPTPKGYGEIQRGGKDGGKVLAHRAMWEMFNGPIPEGMEVCHKCDVPLCVRLSHLFLGTHAENMYDNLIKGRQGQRKKTHCPRGHEYTEANTMKIRSARTKTYGRFCRECGRVRSKVYYHNKRNAEVSPLV